jgi:hypothetical protein
MANRYYFSLQMQNLKDKDREQLQPALAVSLRPAEKQNNKKMKSRKKKKEGVQPHSMKSPPATARNHQPRQLNPKKHLT